MATLGIALALLWPTVESLILEWEDTEHLTYTHGYLIALLSVWLLWRSRPVAGAAAVRAEPRALPVLAVLSFVWLLALRASIEIVHQLLLPLLAWTAVWAALGSHVARRSWFAFAYLYFAVPIWSFGNEILQTTTVLVVGVALRVTDIPFYVTDNLVHTPSGIFEIAGGCSGLHFFIVAVAIAALHGEIHRDSWRVRLLGILIAAGLAMLTNWIRVSALIVIGHATDMQHYLVSVDHYYFGWALFACAMLAYFFLMRFLPAAADVERDEPMLEADPRPTKLIAGAGAAILALSIGPAWSMAVPAGAATLEAPPGLPANLGRWQGPYREPSSAWQPVFRGADVADQGHYRAGDRRIAAFTAAYADQRQGKELVGYGNAVDAGIDAAAIAGSRLQSDAVAVSEIVFAGGDGSRSLLHYYYDIGGWQTPRARAAQLMFGWRSLFSPVLSRVVAVYAECAGDCADEREASLDFLNALQAE